MSATQTRAAGSPRSRARWIETIVRWVERLEEIPIGPAGWAAGFLSIVAVRHFLEIRSSQYPIYGPAAFYVHYVLAYLGPKLALALVLALFSSVPIARVLRLMLLAWGLTLLPPLIDALTARAHEARIGYLELGNTPWSSVLVHFFDPAHPLKGTTPGIRIEAAVACLLGAVYVWLRAPAARALRAAACVAGVYLTALFFFTLPTLFERTVALVLSGVTRSTLYIGIGRIARPAIETVRADQVITLYLIPLTLALGAIALAAADLALLRRAARQVAASEGVGWAIACAVGTAAGWSILDGVPSPAPTVPFDRLAWIAGPLALLLAGGGLALLVPDDEAPRAVAPLGSAGADGPSRDTALRAIGAILAAAGALLGAAASVDLAAMLAIAAGAGLLARGIPSVLPWAFPAPSIASGIAVAAAAVAGYSLPAGADALILFPAGLLVAIFLAGFAADLARAPLPGLAGRAAASRAPRVIAAGAAPLVALAVPALALGALPPTRAIGACALLAASAAAAGSLLAARPAAALSLAAACAVLGLAILAPTETALWRDRALAPPIYFIRLSQQAEARGDLAGAAGAAHEAIRRAPRLASPHQRLALVRMKSGDVAGGLEEFRAAAALDPDDAPLQGNLASALLEAGKAPEALPLFDRTLALDPGLLSTYFNRARCLDALGRRTEADAAWREYLGRAAAHPEEAASMEIARRRLASPAP